ncbi:MAG: phosphatase PAP2 family protein [Desulfomonilaceae bacterium]
MTTFGDGLLLGIVLGMFIVVKPRVTFFGLILLLLSSVIVNTIKMAIPSLRPVTELADVHVVGPILRSGSFPSGHSSAAFAVAISLAHFTSSRSLKAFLLLFGLLVGLSRIFVGAHFPTDVLWGIIVSLAIYELIYKFVWPIIEVYVPALPKLDNFFFKVFSLVEVVTCLFCLFIYSQAFAEYPPVAIAISTGVLTFFGAAYIKLVRSN